MGTIDIAGTTPEEGLDYKHIEFKNAYISQKLRLHKDDPEIFNVRVKYMIYAVDSDGNHRHIQQQPLIFTEERKGKAGFTGVLRREITKAIKQKHNIDVTDN